MVKLISVRTFMNIISGVLHPCFSMGYIIFLLVITERAPNYKFGLLGTLIIALVCYSLMPFLILYLAKAKGSIGSMLPVQKERRRLIFILVVWYAITTYFLKWASVFDKPTVAFFMAIIALLLVLWGLNFLLKVSLHAASMSNLAGYLLFCLWERPDIKIVLLFIGFLAATFMVMYSRLYLKRHTTSEVWVGFLVALLFGFSGSYFFFT